MAGRPVRRRGACVCRLTNVPVRAALALFQTSTLVTVLLGWRVFGERDVAKRFSGAVVMAAGAVLIVVNR
jgi:drug/metabolite transporter (DMT)-like permease